MDQHLPERLFDITLGQERAAAKSQEARRDQIDRDIREGAIFGTNRIIDAGTFRKRQVHDLLGWPHFGMTPKRFTSRHGRGRCLKGPNTRPLWHSFAKERVGDYSWVLIHRCHIMTRRL